MIAVKVKHPARIFHHLRPPFLPLEPPFFPSLTASSFLLRMPSLAFGLRPRSLSNAPPVRAFLGLGFDRFLDDLDSRRSGMPIFCGRLDFLAERMAALTALSSPSSLSSSMAIFRLLAFRVKPDNLSLLGCQTRVVSEQRTNKYTSDCYNLYLIGIDYFRCCLQFATVFMQLLAQI